MKPAAVTTLRDLWETIQLRPPIQGAVHDLGGPEGAWFSISLEELDGPRSWLHFRDTAGGLECAYGDDSWPDALLQWDHVPDGPAVRATMEEFAENFEESRGAHVGVNGEDNPGSC